jgi:hypothetical protein
VNFKVVKLERLSGPKAAIYSVVLKEDDDNEITLLDHFLTENQQEYHAEVKDIISRLRVIGHKTGAREQFFKLHEGVLGDGVCALYDDPDKKLRLYCIRFGSTVLIVGGGGPKPKGMRALQESPKLTQENNYMKIVSTKIAERIRQRDIFWSDDENELLGDFNFYENE